jgi:hypothetical protein
MDEWHIPKGSGVMAASTGPILAVGGLTIANKVLLNNQPWEWKTPIAVGIAALTFAGIETMIGPDIPRSIALVALITVVFARTDPRVPAPAESALKWWNS